MHNTTATKVHTAAVRYSEGDVVIFTGQQEVHKLGLVHHNAFKVLGTADCGCEGYQFIDVGLRHNSQFITCPICNCIIGVDDVYYIGADAFRRASVDEEKDYNEIILNRSLNTARK